MTFKHKLLQNFENLGYLFILSRIGLLYLIYFDVFKVILSFLNLEKEKI